MPLRQTARAALDRLLHYYAHTAQSASISVALYSRPEPDDPTPAHPSAVSDPEAARAWLRAERDNLESASAHARACALPEHALALAAGLAEILRADGPVARALELHQAAADTAARQGYPAAHALALTDLGLVRRFVGDLTGADEALTRALEIYREIGHLYGEAYALTEWGGVRRRKGDVSGAAEALTRALAIYRETGNRGNEAWALNQYADTVAAGGDLPRAFALYRQALEMNRELNKPDDEAIALEGLGQCHLTAGEAETGTVRLREALEIYQRLGMTHDAERVRAQLTDLPTS